METKNGEIGRKGEEAALNWLVKHGYRIRETSYRKPYGEIDIVADKDRTIRFIEVKTSKYYPDSAFNPEMRVNRQKINKLKKICETYLLEQNVSMDQLWQIDVISVILGDDSSVIDIKLFENAVFDKGY